MPTIRLGVDTGGTFTDVIAVDDRGIRTFKMPSTPDDPSRAILVAIERVLDTSPIPARVELVHGTTVGTNALLERTGARTAFVTTAGFEDTLATRRQARPELYNLGVTRDEPLIPENLWFGIDERFDSEGTLLRAIDPEMAERLADEIAASGVASAAISLLFSFANPEHEAYLESLLRERGIAVSCSHRILPEYREYERAATVAVNAYLVPKMSAYLSRLRARGSAHEMGDQGCPGYSDTSAREQGCPRSIEVLRIMQSSGGSISAERAAVEPVRTILSGPAGGVVAGARLSALSGLGDLITFDMGGTSTDVALVADGAAAITTEAEVAGLPIAVPVIDIHTVGAGGGSIAYVDAGGALRVGPESAGADPGPACYGRGERATVTDANVVLGRLVGLLGGSLPLDVERARRVVAELAVAIGRVWGQPCSTEDAALGIVRVASANMERALRVVSVERGYDPRRASLLSFGGAGGLHAFELATALGMRRVVIPPFPGAFSALGLLLGDVIRDTSRTVLGRPVAAEDTFRELETVALDSLRDEGFSPDSVLLERTAALRYVGQSFEIDVPWSDRLGHSFHEAHFKRYGHSDPRRPVEVVHLRVRARGIVDPIELPASVAVPKPASPVGRLRVRLEDVWEDVARFDRGQLEPGHTGDSPALITEYGSTTLVPRGWSFAVDALGSIVADRVPNEVP